MKHFMTAFACLFIMNMSAQTGFVEFPYNPDSDNDDMIGTEDLLGLLSLYGSEFSEEGLYLSTDSTDALYHTGDMYLVQCFKSCYDLPGNWHIATRDEMYKHDLASFPQEGSYYCWIKDDNDGYAPVSPDLTRRMFVGGVLEARGLVEHAHYAITGGVTHQCYCAAHERPNVEYTTCQGEDEEFQSCCNTKVADGWYPLGGIDSADAWFSQAFWRWAE